MSVQRDDLPRTTGSSWSIDELARLQDVQVVADVDALGADGIWDDEEELELFLADLRASRDAFTA